MQLNDNVVRVNGRINVAASLAAMEKVLTAQVETEETAFAGVSQAVLAVFEENKGACINKPAVVSLTMRKMGEIPHAKIAETTDLINAYIDQNKGETGLFLVKKGKGGGVTFRAHAKPEVATAKSE